jgi:hypothetical protein
MKSAIPFLLAILFAAGTCCGCSTSAAPPPKPFPAKRLPDGERALRDSLAHTTPKPRRK